MKTNTDRVSFTHSKNRLFWGGLLAVLFAGVTHAPAQLVINVGNHNLLPGQAGQTIDFFVQNTGVAAVLVAGLSFKVQVADSGPPPGSGTIDGPDISGVDILTGTVFQGNPNGQTDAGSVDQYANFTTDLPLVPGTVSLNPGSTTKIATVTFDTTGFTTPQTWDLRLGATIDQATKYFDGVGNPIVPAITDGSLSVVPEPGETALVSGLLLALFAWRRGLAAEARRSV